MDKTDTKETTEGSREPLLVDKTISSEEDLSSKKPGSEVAAARSDKETRRKGSTMTPSKMSPMEKEKKKGYSGQKKGYSGYPKRSGYPYKSDKKAMMVDGKYLNTATCWGKTQSWIIKCDTLVRAVLSAMTLAIIVCLLVMLIFLVYHQTRPLQPWEMLPPPPAADFDDYSIASSSEFCNEMTRMAIQEGHLPFGGLALLMDYCLSIAEPQAGGVGGDSVTLFVNAKNGSCEHIRAVGEDFWMRADPTNLTDGAAHFRYYVKQYLMKALQGNPLGTSRGAMSTRMPRAYLAPQQILQLLWDKIPPSKFNTTTLERAQYVFKEEFENLHIPVSRRLDEAFTVLMATGTFAMGSTRFLFGHENRHLEEGDLFLPTHWTKLGPATFSPLFQEKSLMDDLMRLLQSIGDVWKDSMNRAVVSGDYLSMLAGVSASQDLPLLFGVTLNSTQNFTELGNGLRVCSATGGRQQKPFVPEMLKGYGGSDAARKSVKDEFRNGTAIYDEILTQFLRFQKEVEGMVASMDYDHEAAERLVPIYQEGDKISRTSIGEQPPFAGNYYAIVDNSKGQALAAGMSIGTEFGANLGQNGALLNNFNSDYLKDYRQIGPYYGLIEPMIVVDAKGKIHTVWAGSAGHSDVSLGIPRTMTTLVYSLFHGVPLEEAITYPLVYSPNGKDIYSKGTIPYSRLWRIWKTREQSEGIGSLKEPARHDLADEAAVIVGGRAVQFMARKKRGSIMPNGF